MTFRKGNGYGTGRNYYTFRLHASVSAELFAQVQGVANRKELPIEQAIQLLVRKGLTALNQEGKGASSNGQTDPVDGSLPR